MSSPLINVMSAAALKAGKGLLRDFGEADQLHISRKGAANFVTAADLRTEKLLQRELSKARPDFGFLMEESGEIPGKDPHHRWVIDPLDGTSNFIHAIPYFCISIGLEKRDASGKSEVIAGVIYDPIHNELFSAEKGKGALVNNRKLAVSGRTTLEDSMLVLGALRAVSKGAAAATPFEVLAKSGAIVRDFGAAALDLAYVAAGRIDACRLHYIQPWDIAAGMLLVKEAGGIVTDLEGRPADVFSQGLVGSNPHLLTPMQKLIDQVA